mmetsp:Transcript_45025/g.66860  ORF Transcript_45025/g.66860 Transcript_45025/m.66860 type:complete len:117 (-) Transcript_45025:731-1081(-)|eukprot:CAMPEP_0194028076 /NCGR_PEP_ID=MMETSP0009_2-20130614/2107_1 /TAXON_ID=210454 /ORGANISM="Grammatophora oceanica, Strain CCMP 410" /LENGTH=116 /DNA_ID=CAMNT_0038667341 /DNA_START=51 /DNA_END=401 /DNA_ORIENTATION=+
MSVYSRVNRCVAPLIVRTRTALQTQRSVWQEVLKQTYDPKTKTVKCEDPMNMAYRMYLDPRIDPFRRKFQVYEKPSRRKYRKNDQLEYRKKSEHVDNMIKYIEFLKERGAFGSKKK